MPQPFYSPRYFLDQAFWGLILSICVIMGGGICVLGFGKKTNSAPEVVDSGSEQRKSTPARSGTAEPGSRRPQTGSEEHKTVRRPTTPPGTRRPAPDESRERPEVAETNRPETPGSPNKIGMGPIETEESGDMALPAQNVSHAVNQFAGIEQRLDKIASNLGTLRDVVTSQQTDRRTGADQSVEFVREFRQLLDAHRSPRSETLDHERSSLTPQLQNAEPGSSGEHTGDDPEQFATLPSLDVDTEGSESPGSLGADSAHASGPEVASTGEQDADRESSEATVPSEQALTAPPELVHPNPPTTGLERGRSTAHADQVDLQRKVATLEALDGETAQEDGVVDLPPPAPPEAEASSAPPAGSQPGPTSVKVFRPRHVSGEDLASRIEPYLTPGVGKLASTEDETGGTAPRSGQPTFRQPAVAVRDTADTLLRISELVEQLDTPTGPGREFRVDVTAVGVRLQTVDENGINLHDLGTENQGFALHSINGSDGLQRCATGMSASAVPANSNLKLAVLAGEENRLLQELRSSGPLQAVARSRVTMRDREASRLVVELDDPGVAGGARVRCLGVRPRLRNDGSVLIEILPCADDAGRPIESSHESLQPIGEITLQPGESAIMAGLIDESRGSHRGGAKPASASRRGSRGAPERMEWLFVVSPRVGESTEVSRRHRRTNSPRMTAER